MAGAIPRPASTIMANPTTTHVIEIETGIGEPAFIPLSMGHELQPISVGKKGMWRIESPRVLDVHAFVYFDGTSLFLQSADEQNAASVDGYRVGKAWTELHAPCKIEVGSARLRYRSLIADADNQPTMMAPSPVVQAPPGGPGGMRPGAGASMPVAGAPPPPAPGNAGRIPQGGHPQQQQHMGTQPPRPPVAQGSAPGVQSGGSAPVAFPKADRPFKPGEFASPADIDESTRIAPLDATGGGRVASGSHPRPAAGSPIGDGPSTRPEAARMMRTGAVPAAAGSAPYGVMGPGGMQPDLMQGGMPPQGAGAMQSGGYPQQGYPPQQQAYGAHGGYSAAGSGAFNAMTGTGPQLPGPPGMPGQFGPSMPPGGYGSMTPQGGMQQPNGPPTPMQEFVAKLKANSIPKIVAGLLFIIGGILYLAEDDEPQVQTRRRPVASLDGGSLEGGTAAGTAAGGTGSGAGPALTAPPVMTQAPTPAWPAGVPCPPPNWPAGTPLPCTPNGVSATPDKPDKPDKGAKNDPKDSGAPGLPPGAKTLERQAVDYVAAGDTAKAAAAYEELVRRDPNNKVYAEAARIMRAKLDGGLSGQ